MKIDAVSFTLADGRECTVRSAAPRDAAAMCRHLRITAAETEFILSSAREAGDSVTEQSRLLRRRSDMRGAVTLCAFCGGVLAGIATVSPYNSQYRTAHRGTMSIALKKAWWGKGIAGILMRQVIDFARSCGYRQLELGVDEQNERAIGLYEHFGFVRCGRIDGALRHDDGSFSAQILMLLPLQ